MANNIRITIDPDEPEKAIDNCFWLNQHFPIFLDAITTIN
jgi:hypothetical protein